MTRVIAGLSVLTGILVALIAWRIHAQAKAEQGPASGSGVVEAEGVDLSSRIAARVKRVNAGEGQRVLAGDVVLTLECDELEARLLEAQARVAAARAQLLAMRSQALAAKGQSAAALASIHAVDAQLGVLSTQHDLAERDATRLETMGEYAAQASRDRARSTALGLSEQQRAARASEQVSKRQAGAASAQAQAAAAQVTAAEESVRAVEALARSAQLAVDECKVKAPRAGVLERVYYDAGELVMVGASVARLIDPEQVTITFYLPNADIAAVRPGQETQVLADAYPGQLFTGRVQRIGLEAEFTPRNVQTRSDRDRLVYPVEVLVTDHAGKLRSGMQASVSLRGAP